MHVPAATLSPHQWGDIVAYLGADDLKALRLVGNKDMHLEDPSLTCNLQLRLDKAPFFAPNNNCTLEQARRWLIGRRRLVINDAGANICPQRVSYLATHGFLDQVSELVVYNCHVHREIFSLLSQLPNIISLKLVSDANDQEGALDELEHVLSDCGNLRSLTHLDIELDCVVHGSRLNFLRCTQDMKSLRLRGFDFSDGISSMGALCNLSSIHLCHGNFYSSPANDAEGKDLIHLMSLTSLEHVHLEGFDNLSDLGLKAFRRAVGGANGGMSVKSLVLKHCQEIDDDCLPSIGRMGHLEHLHLVNSSYDDVTTFNAESLLNLNALTALKSLSLFYVLEDPSDIQALWGLSSLETLNVAFYEPLSEEDLDCLAQAILPKLGSLRKLRIFTEEEEEMGYSCRRGTVDVEFVPFAFGDLLSLE
ncbi:hypothetical protein ACHAXT_002980 [Thalassiosira profunda]